jgi:hypothetical protein
MAADSLHLYIAHAHGALNATAASAFQNIIVWLRYQGSEEVAGDLRCGCLRRAIGHLFIATFDVEILRAFLSDALRMAIVDRGTI